MASDNEKFEEADELQQLLSQLPQARMRAIADLKIKSVIYMRLFKARMLDIPGRIHFSFDAVRKPVAVMAMIALAAISTSSYAYTSQSVTSGSTLYPLKKTIENLESRLVISEFKKLRKIERMSDRRLDEALYLSSSGKDSAHDALKKTVNEAVRNGEDSWALLLHNEDPVTAAAMKDEIKRSSSQRNTVVDTIVSNIADTMDEELKKSLDLLRYKDYGEVKGVVENKIREETKKDERENESEKKKESPKKPEPKRYKAKVTPTAPAIDLKKSVETLPNPVSPAVKTYEDDDNDDAEYDEDGRRNDDDDDSDIRLDSIGSATTTLATSTAENPNATSTIDIGTSTTVTIGTSTSPTTVTSTATSSPVTDNNEDEDGDDENDRTSAGTFTIASSTPTALTEGSISNNRNDSDDDRENDDD